MQGREVPIKDVRYSSSLLHIVLGLTIGSRYIRAGHNQKRSTASHHKPRPPILHLRLEQSSLRLRNKNKRFQILRPCEEAAYPRQPPKSARVTSQVLRPCE